MKPRLPRVPSAAWVALLALLAAGWLTWSPPALAAPARDGAPGPEATRPVQDNALLHRSRALQRARLATVGVETEALEDARSAATLGRARRGSGVVIGADGLVLTIGYLVLEADAVQLVREDGRRIPARVLGYDLATGFGLLQALAPLQAAAVPLGEPARLQPGQPLMVASGGDTAEVGIAELVARRPFAGSWEYAIDGALLTQPPRPDHSGAGLFNADGELVGIGSLRLASVGDDAHGPPATRRPGNLFVPVDLLAPIVDELRRQGHGSASRRAWLGLNCAEDEDGVRVLRVNEDSPADLAGLQAGDRILRIDGEPVTALAGFWQALWRGGPPERAVTLEIRRDDRPHTLTVHSVDRMKTLRRAEGI